MSKGPLSDFKKNLSEIQEDVSGLVDRVLNLSYQYEDLSDIVLDVERHAHPDTDHAYDVIVHDAQVAVYALLEEIQNASGECESLVEFFEDKVVERELVTAIEEKGCQDV